MKRASVLVLSLVCSVLYAAETHLPVTAAYTCNDGTAFTAQYVKDSAWLFLPSKTQKVPHVRSASGAKYENESVTLWTRGNEAMLIRSGKQSTTCTIDRKATIWEAAKLDGADFRAIGNEPGWELLLFNGGEGIIFTTGYGTESHVFKNGAAYEDKRARRTTYSATTRTHKIKITLTPERCQDSMSGESFETTVAIVLDGKQRFSGCGKALH
jgi:membrane-bound inhibitor of C-type lysozyme